MKSLLNKVTDAINSYLFYSIYDSVSPRIDDDIYCKIITMIEDRLWYPYNIIVELELDAVQNQLKIKE